jgi:NAD(P)H-dependent FMN reductase
MYNLKIISSTTRPGRKGPIVARWITEVAKQYGSFNVEMLDLGDVNLPVMNEMGHPRLGKYENNHTKR